MVDERKKDREKMNVCIGARTTGASMPASFSSYSSLLLAPCTQLPLVLLVPFFVLTKLALSDKVPQRCHDLDVVAIS